MNTNIYNVSVDPIISLEKRNFYIDNFYIDTEFLEIDYQGKRISLFLRYFIKFVVVYINNNYIQDYFLISWLKKTLSNWYVVLPSISLITVSSDIIHFNFFPFIFNEKCISS